MSRQDRLSKIQKRKKKLKERFHVPSVLPYEGSKYKDEKYIPLVLATERGIYEAYVISDNTLRDQDAIEAIEDLVQELRSGTASYPFADRDEEAPNDDIVSRIKEGWDHHFSKHPRASIEELIGILRTILRSVLIWRFRGGYLPFLERFLKDMGLIFKQVTKEQVQAMIESGELIIEPE